MRNALLLTLLVTMLGLGCELVSEDDSGSPTVEETAEFNVECIGMSPLLTGTANHFIVRTPLVAAEEEGPSLRCFGLLPKGLTEPGDIPALGTWALLDDPSAGTLSLFHNGEAWTGMSGTITLDEVEPGKARGSYDLQVQVVDDPSRTARATGTIEWCDFARRDDCPTRPSAATLDTELQLSGPEVEGIGYALDCRMLHEPTTGALVVDMELGIWEGLRMSDYYTAQCGELLESPRSTLRFRTGGVTGPGTYGPWAPTANGLGPALPELSWVRPFNFVPTYQACAHIWDSVDVATTTGSTCELTVGEDFFEASCSNVTASPSRYVNGYPKTGDFHVAMPCELRTADASLMPTVIGATPDSVAGGETLTIDLDDIFRDPGGGTLWYDWRLEGDYPWADEGYVTEVSLEQTGSQEDDRAHLIELPVAAFEGVPTAGTRGTLDLHAKAMNGRAARALHARIAVLPGAAAPATAVVPLTAEGLHITPGRSFVFYPVWTDGLPVGDPAQWRIECQGDGSCPLSVTTSATTTAVTIAADPGAQAGLVADLVAEFFLETAIGTQVVGTIEVVAAPASPSPPTFADATVRWEKAPDDEYCLYTLLGANRTIANIAGDAFPDLICPQSATIGVRPGSASGFGDFVPLFRRFPGVQPYGYFVADPGGGEALLAHTEDYGPFYVPFQATLDDDLDDDGEPNESDGCITIADPAQSDPDGDGITGPCDETRGVESLGTPLDLHGGPGRAVFQAGSPEGTAEYAVARLPELEEELERLPYMNLAFAGDFGADGLVDAFVGGGEGPGYLIETGAGYAPPDGPRPVDAPDVDLFYAHSGDFDGDGQRDLIYPNRALIYRWRADGWFEQEMTFEPCCVDLRILQVLHVGDINGDGRDDLVGECNNPSEAHTVCFYYGTPDTMLSPPAVLPYPFADLEEPHEINFADVDQDGVWDFAATLADRVLLRRGL